jgi:hypothetical protein
MAAQFLQNAEPRPYRSTKELVMAAVPGSHRLLAAARDQGQMGNPVYDEQRTDVRWKRRRVLIAKARRVTAACWTVAEIGAYIALFLGVLVASFGLAYSSPRPSNASRSPAT